MQIFNWNSKTHSLKNFICYVGHLLLKVHAYEFALAWDRFSQGRAVKFHQPENKKKIFLFWGWPEMFWGWVFWG